MRILYLLLKKKYIYYDYSFIHWIHIETTTISQKRETFAVVFVFSLHYHKHPPCPRPPPSWCVSLEKTFPLLVLLPQVLAPTAVCGAVRWGPAVRSDPPPPPAPLQRFLFLYSSVICPSQLIYSTLLHHSAVLCSTEQCCTVLYSSV